MPHEVGEMGRQWAGSVKKAPTVKFGPGWQPMAFKRHQGGVEVGGKRVSQLVGRSGVSGFASMGMT